ncbi:phosphatase PAP2 family protein [Clostridium sp. BNL1100]|uniref:phosphatase PAP2 family protein n=1 Tax=Clostridium sp. BNL1100 TaxID=755731 RepID=UPI00024A7902|nr:phosphatase PAP2 family protein [Clostridium sp. BNL1100]AEY65242.1 membrane-associated phospholipid phosphatase [Clostridium sp. BNL1100]
MTESNIKNNNNKIFVNTIFLILLSLAFAGLILLIKSGTIDSFDSTVYDSLRSLKSHSTKQIVKFLGSIGDPQVNLYLGLAIAALGIVVFANKEGYSKYISYAAAILVVSFLNPLLKEIFRRPHPDVEVDKFSFPSSHAAMAFIFYLVLYVVINKRIKIKAGRIALAVFCIIMPLLIGFSRVYLQNHYASDIIGGYLEAGIIFTIAILVNNICEHFLAKK